MRSTSSCSTQQMQERWASFSELRSTLTWKCTTVHRGWRRWEDYWKNKNVILSSQRTILSIKCLFPLTNQHLDQLLSQVCGILEKHTAGIVLEACTYVVNVLCSNAYTFSSRANLVFSQLMDSLVERFNTYLSDLLEVGVNLVNILYKWKWIKYENAFTRS